MLDFALLYLGYSPTKRLKYLFPVSPHESNRLELLYFDASSMRDRGIVLDPYLDHGVLVRVCQEVGVSVEELDPSTAGTAQVSPCTEHAKLWKDGKTQRHQTKKAPPVKTVGFGRPEAWHR